MTETVTVEADVGRLQIQSESAERSDLVTNKQLRDIALNGRNITDLFKTIPGVIAGTTHHHLDRAERGRELQHQRHARQPARVHRGRRDQPEPRQQHRRARLASTPTRWRRSRSSPRTTRPSTAARAAASSRSPRAAGTNEYRGGGRYFRRHESYNANNFFNNANDRPAPVLPLQLLRLGPRRARAVPRHQGRPEGLLLRRPGVLRPADAGRHPTNIRVPTAAERAGNFSRHAGRHRPAGRHPRPADRPALPRQRHPVRAASPRACRRCMASSRCPTRPKAGRSTTTPRSSRATSRAARTSRAWTGRSRPARGSARATSTTRTRTVQPLGTTTAAFNFPLAASSRPQERAGRRLLAHPHPHLQPDPDQRVHLRRRAAAGSSSAPSNLDDVTGPRST